MKHNCQVPDTSFADILKENNGIGSAKCSGTESNKISPKFSLNSRQIFEELSEIGNFLGNLKKRFSVQIIVSKFSENLLKIS